MPETAPIDPVSTTDLARLYLPVIAMVAGGAVVGAFSLLGMWLQYHLRSRRESRARSYEIYGELASAAVAFQQWERSLQETQVPQTRDTLLMLHAPTHKAYYEAEAKHWSERVTEALQAAVHARAALYRALAQATTHFPFDNATLSDVRTMYRGDREAKHLPTRKEKLALRTPDAIEKWSDQKLVEIEAWLKHTYEAPMSHVMGHIERQLPTKIGRPKSKRAGEQSTS